MTPRTVAHQASLFIGFSRQESWSGLLFPSPGDLPDPGIKPGSSALQADSLPIELPGKPLLIINWEIIDIHYISFWCTQTFSICIYCEMITIVSSLTSITTQWQFFVVVVVKRMFRIYFQGSFLGVQWLRLCFHRRGTRFNSWSGN